MIRKLTITGVLAIVVLFAAISTATAGGPPTAQGLRADGLRWQAMADFYGRQQGLKADGLRWQAIARAYQAAGATVTPSSAESTFNWGDAGIGAASGAVLLLFAGGAIVFVRRGRRAKLAH